MTDVSVKTVDIAAHAVDLNRGVLLKSIPQGGERLFHIGDGRRQPKPNAMAFAA